MVYEDLLQLVSNNIFCEAARRCSNEDRRIEKGQIVIEEKEGDSVGGGNPGSIS